MSSSEEQAPLIRGTRRSRGLLSSIGSLPNDSRYSLESDAITRETDVRGRMSFVCLLLVMFLQSFGTNCDTTLKFTLGKLFDINRRRVLDYFMPLVAIGALLVYFLPIVVGLYADTYAGRYKSLFLGLGLKLLGSFLGFIVILLFESERDISAGAFYVMFAVYAFSLIFLLVGIVFIVPSAATFCAHQVEANFYGVASLFMWLCLIIAVGITSSEFLFGLRTTMSVLDPKNPHHGTVVYAVQLGCDAISIAMFLFGKLSFKIQTTEEGENAWKEISKIIKTRIFCAKSSEPQNESMIQSLQARQLDEIHRKTLDKLKIKKTVFLIVLMFCFAISIAMCFLIHQIFNVLQWGINPHHVVRRSLYLPIIIGAPITEIVFRRFGSSLKPETTANQLKTIAVAASFAVLAILIGGVVTLQQQRLGLDTVPVYWLIPYFLLIGASTFLAFTSAFTFCYMASPRGLETFVSTILFCLIVLVFLVSEGITPKLDVHVIHNHNDTICFATAGFFVGVLLLVYLPFSRWYLRAERALEVMEEFEPHTNSSIQLSASGSDSCASQC